MSHGEFIKRLNRGIEGRVKGYFEDDDGCLLYLSRDDTIYVPSMYIERREDELLDLLQDAIREGVSGAHAIALSRDELLLRPSLPDEPAGPAE